MNEYTPEEEEAIAHIKRRIEVDGLHSLNACPRFTRAMCKYRIIIQKMAHEKRLPDFDK